MGNDEAKLFVAGLPDSISEDVLKQIFEATGGSVVNVSLPKDRATGRPRGFGFVTLSTPAEAQLARDALDGVWIGDEILTERLRWRETVVVEQPEELPPTEPTGLGHTARENTVAAFAEVMAEISEGPRPLSSPTAAPTSATKAGSFGRPRCGTGAR